MKALTPGLRSPRRPGLPSYCNATSRRSIPNHVVCTIAAFVAIASATRLLPGFAMNEKARRNTPPKRVRFTTDRQFASGCSPPRLSANAVTFGYGAVAHPGADFHHTVTRHQGRTHSREGGNPGLPGRLDSHLRGNDG